MSDTGLSPLDYHLLLALAPGETHGYALREAVEEESDGAVRPRAGTLYRAVARLLGLGWVVETEGPRDEAPHPGRSRRYYALSPLGRETLAQESRRLRDAVALAERRLRTNG